MRTDYLFPNTYKKVGWLLLISGLVLGTLPMLNNLGLINSFPSFLDFQIIAPIHGEIMKGTQFGVVIQNDLTDELAAALFLIGGVLIAFSKEKIEDEFIAQIRLESLVWATYVNYGLLLLSILLVYGLAFLDVLIFNMFTLLIFFIIRFHLSLYQVNHSYQLHEK